MSRTPLFAAVKKALALASRDDPVVGPRTSALTRRQMLRLSAAAAGATALAPVFNWSAHAKKPGPSSIAIIGGGVAGLTAAYRLQKHGAKPILFEASNRWGGRMFTRYEFCKGMFCELGGELVDLNHEDMEFILCELGLQRQELKWEDVGQELYYFKGDLRTAKDVLDPHKHSGAFVPIAKQIRYDRCRLKDKHQNWTAHARHLDNTSLKKYLQQLRSKIKDDWVIDLLDVAYVNENGLETEHQSSLNLVNVIGTALDEEFSLFGESDSAYRIWGGSSALIEALVHALEGNIEMKLGYALTELDYQGEKIVMGFDAPGGAQTQNFDAVILALPFTKLRQVKGLDRLNLSREKLNCINKLGMGKNAKIMVGTTSRVWGSPECDLRVHGLRVRSNGSMLSDLKFQGFWETSNHQQPNGGKAGILTVFLGGDAAQNTTRSLRSPISRKASARYRRRWPTVSTRTQSRQCSGAIIPTRSAATPPSKSDNTLRCLTRRRNQLLAAACDLPASTRAA